MNLDWSSLIIAGIIGFIFGIPSGIIANLFFHKIRESRKRKEEYCITDTSPNGIEFRGRVLGNTSANISDIMASISIDITERAKKAKQQQETMTKYIRDENELETNHPDTRV